LTYFAGVAERAAAPVSRSLTDAAVATVIIAGTWPVGARSVQEVMPWCRDSEIRSPEETMAKQPELQVQQKREVEKKQGSTIPARVFLPVTDIFESDEALTVVMEMPGVDKNNVDVRVENDILTVEGRLDFSKYEGMQPLYTEYNVGNYARSFHLSSEVAQDQIGAELNDGIMTLVPA
jgi:HSP20 family protein